jgi:hypothetical protein
VAGKFTTVWLRFWFADVPPHSYAVLRILFGTVGLLGLVALTPVSMYWPLDSIASLPGGSLGLKAQIAAIGLGGVAGWVLFVVLVVSFSCMTIGYRAALAVPLSFAATLLQTMWNPLPLSGAHHVFVALLFCLMFANCGRVLSVDAWLRRETASAGIGTNAIWPLRLLRVQVALVYLNSGLWKLFGPTWRDGSAVLDVLGLNVFHRFPVDLPNSFEWVATIATYGTLLWEISFPLLMFHPLTRALALICGVGIHLGLWATLELGTFSGLMIASYVAFLEPTTVERIVIRFLAPSRSVGSSGPKPVEVSEPDTSLLG